MILHVDDDADTRLIAELAIGLDDGFRIDGAASGTAALTRLDEVPDWRPDAFLLDYRLPDMSGSTLFCHIRRRPRFATTPIIFMTAMARSATSDSLMAMGAAGVLAKPFNPLTLAASIRRLLVGYAPSGC